MRAAMEPGNVPTFRPRSASGERGAAASPRRTVNTSAAAKYGRESDTTRLLSSATSMPLRATSKSPRWSSSSSRSHGPCTGTA